MASIESRGSTLIDLALRRLDHVAPAERSNPSVLVPALVDALAEYLFTPAGAGWLTELAPGGYPRLAPIAEGRPDVIDALHEALVQVTSAPDAPPAFADCVEIAVALVFGPQGPGRPWSTSAVPASPFTPPAPLDLPRPVARPSENPIGDLWHEVAWDELPHPIGTIHCHITFADSCAYDGKAYPHQAELDRLVAEANARNVDADTDSDAPAAARGASIGHGF